MGGAPAWTGTWHATGRPAGTKASQVPHRALAHDPSLFYSTHRQKCGTRCCCPAAEPPVPREARSSITRVRWVSCGSVPEPMLALIYARQRWAHSRSPTLDQDLVHSRSARWTKAVSSVHPAVAHAPPVLQVLRDRHVGHGAPSPAATAAAKLSRSCSSWCCRLSQSTWPLWALSSGMRPGGTWQSWWSKEACPAAAPPAPPHSWGQLYVRSSCRQVPLYVGGSRRNSSMLECPRVHKKYPTCKRQ